MRTVVTLVLPCQGRLSCTFFGVHASRKPDVIIVCCGCARLTSVCVLTIWQLVPQKAGVILSCCARRRCVSVLLSLGKWIHPREFRGRSCSQRDRVRCKNAKFGLHVPLPPLQEHERHVHDSMSRWRQSLGCADWWKRNIIVREMETARREEAKASSILRF